MASHETGETFVLIEPGVLQVVPLLPSAIGTVASIKARGLADGEATPVVRTIGGEAMRPPSPINLMGEMLPDGALSLTWTRRSRLGWFTAEDVGPPLGESAERYRITLQVSAGTLTFESTQPALVVPADQIAGMTGSVTIEVVQIGDFAQSRPARLSLEF